jgi:hypothetical protein
LAFAGRRFRGGLLLTGWLAALSLTLAGRLAPLQRFFAEGADRPARVDRLFTRGAGVLEPALALRTAHIRRLDWEGAARAGKLFELAHSQLGCLDLELSLVGVFEKLRRSHDGVDGGAQIWDECTDRRDTDQEGVGDASPGVEIRVDDQRQPDNDQHEDEEVDDQIEAVVADTEDRYCHGWARREGGAVYFAALEEKPAEQVAEPEEDEDHRSHNRSDQGHHRQQFRSGAALHASILA